MSPTPSPERAPAIAALLAVLGGVAGGCAVGSGPEALRMEPVEPRVAFVGSALEIGLEADDPEGDPLRWRFESDVPDMCRDGRCRAGIAPAAPARATFHWTPRPEDVGTWRLRFLVTDGETVDSVHTTVEVRSAEGYEGVPRFVQPLGTGTTLDLASADCVELDVVVDDPDSPGVTIAQREPGIGGATLTQHDGFTAGWRWCPSDDQLRGSGHRRLVLTASDDAHPATEKSFLIVLRRPPKPGCRGSAPVVEHTPVDWRGAGDVRVTARVRDDGGVKHAPQLYWSTADPGPSPDLARMTQVSMRRVSGDARDGVWEARLEGVAAALAGETSGSLHYVIGATDGGDGAGGCELVTDSPPSGAHRIAVALDGAGEPPEGGEGCEPDCAPPTPTTCADDDHEPDDDLAAARLAPALSPGATADRVSCHLAEDDEDWYRVVLDAPTRVIASLTGGDDTDLDLALRDDAGELIALSESLRSTEEVTACLPAGAYYLQVHSFGEGRNEYGLAWDARAASCEPDTCEPDPHEADDDAASARAARPSPAWSSEGNTICDGSDDWYRVELEAGETLTVDLSFIQTTFDEDLDLHFLDADGTDLTPCTEADPSTCSALQGQSVDSNEHYEHTAAASGTYYVVVHGFAGAQNGYDIRLEVER